MSSFGVLLPSGFSKRPRTQPVPSLRQLCERCVIRHVDSFASFESLSAVALQRLMAAFQERFALDSPDVLHKFLLPALSAWTVREPFVDEPLLLQGVAQCRNLTRLELWGQQLAPSSWQAIGALQQLQCVALHAVTAFDNACAVALFGPALCARLEELTVVGVLPQLSDEGMSQVANCAANLRVLLVENASSSLTDQWFCKVAKCAARSLKAFCTNYCEGMSDRVLLQLAECCPNLETLQLHDADVSDKGVIALLRKDVFPIELDLSLTGISCDSLAALEDNLKRRADRNAPGVRRLNLSSLYNVTKEFADNLFYCLDDVEELYLSEMDELDDESVEIISTCCSKLQRLDVSECPLIGDAGVSQLVSNLDNLRYLNLQECEKISVRLRVILVEQATNIQLLL